MNEALRAPGVALILGSLAFLLTVPVGFAVWHRLSQDRLVATAVEDALGSDVAVPVRITGRQRLRETNEQRLFRIHRVCGIAGVEGRRFGALVYRRRSGFPSEWRVLQTAVAPAQRPASMALLKECEG